MCKKIIATAVLAAAAYMPLASAADMPEDVKSNLKKLPLHWESVEQPNIAKAVASGKKNAGNYHCRGREKSGEGEKV